MTNVKNLYKFLIHLNALTMDGFENSVVEKIIHKFGIHDEPQLNAKTLEFLRLLQLKSSILPPNLGDHGKVVICIDFAANILGIEFDYDIAYKLSGLRRSNYLNHKRTIQKLLDINKILNISDICVQLGITDITTEALNQFENYKININERNDIDINHPQYASMAVYKACKNCKKKISKSKFISLSHLKPTQWLRLEQEWDKFVPKKTNIINDIKENIEYNSQKYDNEDKINIITEEKIEGYEVWKERMLKIAYENLSLGK